jgi:outer membrane protein assembly factor BamB
VQCDLQDRSFWAAFDAATGEERIRVERGDDPTWATPTVVTDSAGEDLVVCNGYRKMAAYELATGAVRWHLGGGGDVPVPRPIPVGDGVLITNAHGPMRPIYLVRVDARGDLTPPDADDEVAPDGIRWWHAKRGSYMPTPIVVGDGVFVADDNGVLTRFSLADGSESYRHRLPGGRQATYSASPVAAAGRLYVGNENGRFDVLAAGETFEVLGSSSIGEACFATPAISQGRLYIRGVDHLFCIGDSPELGD